MEIQHTSPVNHLDEKEEDGDVGEVKVNSTSDERKSNEQGKMTVSGEPEGRC